MGKVLKVREVGDPILEKQCDEVNIKNINENIIDIIEDLKSTLEFGTGLGIAAPQIGVDKRIIVVGAKKENIKYNDAEEKELQYIATIKSTKNPKNMEFQYVYLLNCNKKIEEYIFEDNEVSEVEYIFYKDLEKMVEEKIEGLLIHEAEYKYLFKYITHKNIKIRKCNANDVDLIYNIQNIVIDNFKEEEKGYFLPFKKETYSRIVNDPINDGEIYGAFIDNKMIAWIFLSVSNRMKELKQMIPNIKGNCADIDGVIVLPEYRGYGLQKILVKYLEEKAREKGISNIIAEVTFENVYSLRNLKDLGYEEQTWYQKDENIKRYILLKKLGEEDNE